MVVWLYVWLYVWDSTISLICIQVHWRVISCDAEIDQVVERNQCEYDPS